MKGQRVVKVPDLFRIRFMSHLSTQVNSGEPIKLNAKKKKEKKLYSFKMQQSEIEQQFNVFFFFKKAY